MHKRWWGWEGVLKPVVARIVASYREFHFRADAGLTNPKFYEYLEAERIKYAIRLQPSRARGNQLSGQEPCWLYSLGVRRSYAIFSSPLVAYKLVRLPKLLRTTGELFLAAER